MNGGDYKAAYERQKLARARAEDVLENRSRELYESNMALKEAYEKLKDQKSQLLHQEKLASIGQLSAGIAHEINNPAGFVKSNLVSLKNYTNDLFKIYSIYHSLYEKLSNSKLVNLPNDFSHDLIEIKNSEEELDIDYLIEDIPNLISESIDGADRITKIVNGLKTFSRIDSDQKELVNVNECIENTIKLVQNEIKYKAELKQDFGELPVTMGYPGSLSQVILNMLVNATHAIDGFGEISIQTLCNKEWITIRIKDNGSGMEEQTVNKIFDPFYTTKEVGVGTGLGLSISSGIVEKHGGKIEVDTEVGKGTCFSILIPIVKIDEKS